MVKTHCAFSVKHHQTLSNIRLFLTGIYFVLINIGGNQQTSVNGQLTATTSGGGTGAASTNVNGEILLPKTSSLGTQEPTCEELRAMWRFSKRQSRAAEITNEIPTYRDPFAYNIWEPYIATTRSIGGVRVAPRYRDSARPVYGRILHREPLVNLFDRNSVIDDFPRGFTPADGFGMKISGASGVGVSEPRRHLQLLRFAGYRPGGSGNINGPNQLTQHHGSFQKLKELIWTERARELASQRKAEELAARVAVLKEIANGQNVALRRQMQEQNSPLVDENRSPDTEHSSSFLSSLPTDQKGTSKMSSSGKSSSGSGIGSSAAATGFGSLRSGGVFIPVGSGSLGQLRTHGYGQPPSIFRERNRALHRQALTPPLSSNDFYQRNLRKDIEANDNCGNCGTDINSGEAVLDDDDIEKSVAEMSNNEDRSSSNHRLHVSHRRHGHHHPDVISTNEVNGDVDDASISEFDELVIRPRQRSQQQNHIQQLLQSYYDQTNQSPSAYADQYDRFLNLFY